MTSEAKRKQINISSVRGPVTKHGSFTITPFPNFVEKQPPALWPTTLGFILGGTGEAKAGVLSGEGRLCRGLSGPRANFCKYFRVGWETSLEGSPPWPGGTLGMLGGAPG